MPDLIVAGFQGTHRAAEVVDQLVELKENWAIDLKDALAVYRTDDGRLRVEASVQPTTTEGAAWGGIIGGLIGGLLMAPVTAGASAAAAVSAIGAGALTLGTSGAVLAGADADEMKQRFGISDDFVQQVSGMVQPGQSAVFVLASSQDPEKVAQYFKGAGATILRTTLPPEKAQRIQQVIGTEQRPAAR